MPIIGWPNGVVQVLPIRRLAKPFENRYAFSSGFIQGESLDVAAAGELREEAGMEKVYL